MAIPDNWWKDFFSGLTVEMWRAVSTPEDNRTEAAWIEKQLQVSPPAKLLDVPCGDGRLALELAARGYEMAGVDLSREFLAAARKTADERGLGAKFEQYERSVNPAERKKLAEEIQRGILENYYVVPVFRHAFVNAIGPKVVAHKWQDVFPTITTGYAYPWEDLKVKE